MESGGHGGGHTGSEETMEKSPTLVPCSFLRFDLRVDVESYLDTVSCFFTLSLSLFNKYSVTSVKINK
jgi:hypothetical protein